MPFITAGAVTTARFASETQQITKRARHRLALFTELPLNRILGNPGKKRAELLRSGPYKQCFLLGYFLVVKLQL
jgi:hypothetical protein